MESNDYKKKDVLVDLFINKRYTIPDIANLFGKTKSCINNYIQKYSLHIPDPTRRVELDKEALYKLFVIDKKTKKEIEKIFCCCRKTLNKNLKSYGFTKYENYSESEICRMYTDELKSLTQIHDKTNFPKSKIREILLKNGIILRDKSSCQNINLSNVDRFPDFDISVLQTQSLLKRKCQSFFKNHIANVIKKERGYICELCGSKEKLHAHHIKPQSLILNTIINENQNCTEDELYNIIINDERFLDKENIKIVCETCHYTVYHKYTHYHANQQPSSL